MVRKLKIKMENYELYKEFYFFEINRKNELNNAINIPIVALSLIISIHFFLFSQDLSCLFLAIGKLLASITLLSLSYSIFFLLKSFSNFHKAHTYREIPTMSKIHDYKVQIKNEEKFESFLVDEFVACTTHNFEINKVRTEDLAKAKKTIFVAFITTFLFSIIYIISIL